MIEETLGLGNDQCRARGTFRVVWLGLGEIDEVTKTILVSTDDELDDEILKYPRYGVKDGKRISGGYSWDTFGATCFGFGNLIMAEGAKHTRLSRMLGPLFRERVVRKNYFDALKAVTQATVIN